MSTRTRVTRAASAVLAVVGLVAGSVWASARQQEADRDTPQDRALSMFMLAKLDHSKDILEGITTGDFTKVVDGAEALRQLTENERWRVSPNITYMRYTEEFERLTDALEQQGRAENIDGATLNYVNLTINCVNCHKFVRDQRITRLDPPAPIRR